MQIPFAIACGVLGTATVAAAEPAPDCGHAELRKAGPGFSCRTSTGHEFRLEYRSGKGKEFWLDVDAGLIWGDNLSRRIRRRAAAVLCHEKTVDENAYGKVHLSRLPTLADARTAEEHGFREVLPELREHFFWLDSKVPGAVNIGHVFNGNFGKPELVVYRSINFENIRCVGRR